MKVREKTIVPRNPYAVAANQRQAGSHEKTYKSKRKQEKQQLQKSLNEMEKGGNFPPFL